jgi:hypothetical protein
MKDALIRWGAIAGVAFGLSGPVLAHHSVAMFDLDKKMTVHGTVKEFQYTNPHSWLQLMVAGDDGKVVQWSFEAQGPSTLLRKGVKAKTFAPGDKMTIVAKPMKDGRPGGLLVSATTADGRAYTM